MDFQQDGRLYVIDSYHGLYAVNVDTGEQELIWDIKSDVFGGERVGFANAYTVLPNGSFLITDTSERHRHISFALSFLEFQPQGKLVIYNPETKETHALLQNLSFPNGLLLSKDGSYVLVSEMGYARILKCVGAHTHTFTHMYSASECVSMFSAPLSTSLPCIPQVPSTRSKSRHVRCVHIQPSRAA